MKLILNKMRNEEVEELCIFYIVAKKHIRCIKKSPQIKNILTHVKSPYFGLFIHYIKQHQTKKCRSCYLDASLKNIIILKTYYLYFMFVWCNIYIVKFIFRE